MLSVVRSRRSRPRCLECGSTDVHAFPHKERPARAGQKSLVGFRHPGCGGELYVETHMRVAFRTDCECFPTLLYSPEGKLIGCEEPE